MFGFVLYSSRLREYKPVYFAECFICLNECVCQSQLAATAVCMGGEGVNERERVLIVCKTMSDDGN